MAYYRHIGNYRVVTNEQGKPVWQSDYTPFGGQFAKNSDSDFEEWNGFTGKELDPDIGKLIYFNARWYDGDIGRFISEDPARDPNNPNLYTYAANNPLRFNDPTGLDFNLGDVGITSITGGNFNLADAGDKSLLMEENIAWAQKVKREGYTVYDIGLEPKYISQGNFDKGPYYGMETQTIFGDK